MLAALVDDGFEGRMARVTSKDSFVPLGDAAKLVLVSEDEIVALVDHVASIGDGPRTPDVDVAAIHLRLVPCVDFE